MNKNYEKRCNRIELPSYVLALYRSGLYLSPSRNSYISNGALKRPNSSFDFPVLCTDCIDSI